MTAETSPVLYVPPPPPSKSSKKAGQETNVVPGKEKSKKERSRKKRVHKITYIDADGNITVRTTTRRPGESRGNRVAPDMVHGDGKDGQVAATTSKRRSSRRSKKELKVVTSMRDDAEQTNSTPSTSASTTPRTPAGVRGSTDLRSPGIRKTPRQEPQSTPDFITQTDQYGNASTPRNENAIVSANGDKDKEGDGDGSETDACDTMLDSLRMMCCCLLPDENTQSARLIKPTAMSSSSEGLEEEPHSDVIRLLPKLHPDDYGKKCLVLDLDETLVHSSFRAVPGADFVIPVQIEDVVHFVYVMKRPGVDEFLLEMAKHYEIVIFTASLNKYADPLLDLLDPHRVIRSRLFRESCVYHEGNYVKDMSHINRDLSQSIIVDNSPNSFLFHPENAIDCSSFIDDPADRELDQIGNFLAGIKDVRDVRQVCSKWRDWPHVDVDVEQPVPEDER